MKTQNFLKNIRLMTFLIIATVFSMGLQAADTKKELRKAEKGEVEVAEESAAPRIDLEDWMLNLNNFRVKETDRNVINYDFSDDAETEVHLEDWMLNSTNFMTVEEQELDKIECWMLDKNKFRVKYNELDKVEDWMIDPEFWKV